MRFRWEYFSFAFIRGFEGLLGLLRAIIVPRILGSTYYAFVHLFSLIGFFFPLLESGTISGLQKKLAMSSPQSDPLLQKQWKHSAFGWYFSFVSLASFFLALGVTIWPEVWIHYFVEASPNLPPHEVLRLFFWGGLLYSILLPLQALEFYFQSVALAESHFRILGNLILIKNLVNTLFVLSCVYFLGVYAIWIGLVVSTVLVSFYMIRLNAFPWSFWNSFSLATAKNLIVEGLPALFLTFFSQMLLVIDRLMLLYFQANMEEFGYYVLGLAFVNYLFIIPHAISQIFFPAIYHKTTLPVQQNDLQQFFVRPVLGLLGFTTFSVGWAYIVLPDLIHWLLPNWIPGIAAAQAMIWMTCFYGPIQLGVPLFSGRGKFKTVLAHQIPTLLFAILSNYYVLKQGYGIVGVALTTVLTTGVYCFALMTSGFYECEGHFRGYGKFVFSGLFLFGYTTSISLGLAFLLPFRTGDGFFFLQQILLKTVLYFLPFLPLLYGLEKKNHFFGKFLASRS